MAVKDWYKLKQYAHIGLPFKPKDKPWLVNYVTNPDNIRKHRFTPFIKRKIVQRKYRAAGTEKNKYGKRIREVKLPPKERPILYASHMDSLIYSYYSYKLTEKYEQFLHNKSYKNCPVAYRKLKKESGKKGNKCNIEFAYDAFKAIYDFKKAPVSIIIADVSNFFEGLDHKILHNQWKKVLNIKNEQGKLFMPDDHYNIYRSLTKKRYVNLNELHNSFYKNIWVERFKPNEPKTIVWKQKRVAKQKNFRRERVIAFCEKKELFDNHKHLIRSERRGKKGEKHYKNSFTEKGIPQGSPMSATLANIYMLDFDEQMFSAVSDVGGFYQRYSDDLILICPRSAEKEIHQALLNAVRRTDTCNLDIHTEKTKLYRYSFDRDHYEGGLVCSSENVNKNYQLEYLGFEFNGGRVYVKTQGISKYYRSMIRSIKRGKFYASKKHHKEKGLFKARLIKRFTILGGKRIMKRIPDPERPGKYLPDPEKRYNWGNYFSYLLKANHVMKDLNDGNDTIKLQSRKFEKNFHHLIKNRETRLHSRKKVNSKKEN